MARQADSSLSRRERQIMDVIYQQGAASAADVLENLPDPPSYSAVRALLRVLEQKGHLRHDSEGSRYIYKPTRSRRSAARQALQRMLDTFFEGSAEKAMAALLDISDLKLSKKDLNRLRQLIEESKL